MKTLFGRGLDKPARDEFERLRLQTTVTRETSAVQTPSISPINSSSGSKTINVSNLIGNTDIAQIAHLRGWTNYTETKSVGEDFVFAFEANRIYSFSGYFASFTNYNYRPGIKFNHENIAWCKGLVKGFYATSDRNLEIDPDQNKFGFDFLENFLYFNKRAGMQIVSHSYLVEIEGTLLCGPEDGAINLIYYPATQLELLEGHYSSLLESSYIEFQKGPLTGE